MAEVAFGYVLRFGEGNGETQGQETTAAGSQAGTENLRAQHCIGPRGVTGAGKICTLQKLNSAAATQQCQARCGHSPWGSV